MVASDYYLLNSEKVTTIKILKWPIFILISEKIENYYLAKKFIPSN